MKNEYPEDCIHLKACRRLCKIAKIASRGCNFNCSAYETNEVRLYTREEVEKVMRGAAEAGARGYTGGDNLIEDFL